MNVARLLLAVTLLTGPGPAAGSAAASPALPPGRTFYMGVTPAAHDDTPDGVKQAYAFIRGYTDLNVHHFDDGVPWPEALAGTPYHPNVEKDLKERAERLVKGRPTYVAVTGFASTVSPGTGPRMDACPCPSPGTARPSTTRRSYARTSPSAGT